MNHRINSVVVVKMKDLLVHVRDWIPIETYVLVVLSVRAFC